MEDQCTLKMSTCSEEVCRKVPKGSRLDACPERLSVLSYNLLAPTYVRPLDARTGEVQEFAAFLWAEPACEVLDWAARQPVLAAELQSCGADIIALQEVEFDDTGGGAFALPAWISAVTTSYCAAIPDQRELEKIADRNLRVLSRRAAIGNALLFRSDRLELAPLPVGVAHKDGTTRIGRALRGRADGPLESLGTLCVFSVHLDATSEDKRRRLLEGCLEHARACGTREAIIAGDMNTEALPGSCVGAFVVERRAATREELERECNSAMRSSDEAEEEAEGGKCKAGGVYDEWETMHKNVVGACTRLRIELSRAPTGPTRAAFAHGAIAPPCLSWSLDHIFYTRRSLALQEVWEGLDAEANAAAAEIGLPCRGYPSDHLPVAATFSLLQPALLPPEETLRLLAAVADLEEQHILERAALVQRLDEEKAQVDAEVAAEAGGAEQAKDGKKAKSGPPDERVQRALRKRREEDRELKQRHKIVRSALVAGLSPLQMDRLEQGLAGTRGLALDEWVEGQGQGQGQGQGKAKGGGRQ